MCLICKTSALKMSSTLLHETIKTRDPNKPSAPELESEGHFLCYECLRSYVEQITNNKVYSYRDNMGQLKKYSCPVIGCTKYFTHELVGAAFSPEENSQLLHAAREEFKRQYKPKI